MFGLTVEVSEVVSVLVVGSLHALKCLMLVTSLELNEGVGEETLGCDVVILSELLSKPIQDHVKMLLSFVIVNGWDLLDLVVHHMWREIVVDYKVAPNLNDLREESLGVTILANLLEKLS